MDVRGVLRRSRLSLVASLFLAALLGGPAVAVTVTEPVAVTGAAAVGLTGPVVVTQEVSPAVSQTVTTAVTTATAPDVTAAVTTALVPSVTIAGPARDRLTPASSEVTAGVVRTGGLLVAALVAAALAVPPRTAHLTSRLRVAVAGPRAPPAAA